MWSFFAKKERSLGIDFGTSSIKLVQLSLQEGKIKLETYGEVRAEQLKDGLGAPTISLEEHELAEMVKQLVSETKARPENVNISIPIFSSFVTMMEMPVMSQQELAQAIPFQARKYVPVSLSEVILDWTVSGRRKTENGVEVINILLVAIPNDLFERQKKIAKLAGITSDATLEMETFALARVASMQQQGTLCLVDIGAHSTDIAVVDNGVVQMAHNIDTAGVYLTQKIANSLNVPINRAEMIKQSLSEKGGAAANLSEIISPFFDVIVVEINRIIEEYSSFSSKKVDKLIFSGGGSLQSLLLKHLGERIGLPAFLIEPFSKVEYPDALQGIIKTVGPAYAVGVGLAMNKLVKSLQK